MYAFEQGPRSVRSLEDASQKGLNCVALAHLVIKDLFACSLPSELDCVELFGDTTYFNEVGSVEDAKLGDLVWFGVETPRIPIDEFEPNYQNGELINWRYFPVKHVGIIWKNDKNMEPLVMHTTHLTGTNTVWSISKFRDHKRYKKLYGVTRLKAEFYD